MVQMFKGLIARLDYQKRNLLHTTGLSKVGDMNKLIAIEYMVLLCMPDAKVCEIPIPVK